MSTDQKPGIFVCDKPPRMELVFGERDGTLTTRSIPLSYLEMTQIGLALLLVAGAEIARLSETVEQAATQDTGDTERGRRSAVN